MRGIRLDACQDAGRPDCTFCAPMCPDLNWKARALAGLYPAGTMGLAIGEQTASRIGPGPRLDSPQVSDGPHWR